MTSQSTRPATRRTTMTIAMLLAAVALLLPTAAQADPPDQAGVVERAPFLSSWIFWDGDLIVLTGPPLNEATCIGLATEGFDYEGFLKPVATTVATPSGVQVDTLTHRDRTWVHDPQGTTDPLGWVLGTCEAILGAGAPAPQPLAGGEGVVHVHLRTNADGVEHGSVNLTARVTTTDGREVSLNIVGGRDGPPDFINYRG